MLVGYVHSNKNKLVNIQELLLLLNLTVMYAVSYQGSGSVFSTVTNVMISLAFTQFCTIVLYHFLMYTCHYNIETILQNVKEKTMGYCHRSNDTHHNVTLCDIPECTHNYKEYCEGLDFFK